MLLDHRTTFRGPHPIKNKTMLAGCRFTLRGPQLGRGPRVADPWFEVYILLLIFDVIKFDKKLIFIYK